MGRSGLQLLVFLERDLARLRNDQEDEQRQAGLFLYSQTLLFASLAWLGWGCGRSGERGSCEGNPNSCTVLLCAKQRLLF